MSTQDRPLIDTPTRAETIDELTHRFAAEEVAREMHETAERASKVLALLASRAYWGWAVMKQGAGFVEFLSPVLPDNDLGYAELGFRPMPVLVVPSYGGHPLVLRLTEAELADLGPCPNL